ncbi:MAG TPA: hypothetical protein VHP14_06450 [Anaerolineales bacterium]|nr:hypothetical protein [Anaerolineales bacterium]
MEIDRACVTGCRFPENFRDGLAPLAYCDVHVARHLAVERGRLYSAVLTRTLYDTFYGTGS